jgi:hypothetical protein
MKAIHWIIAAAGFAFVQPASAATSDPEVIIYRFPGVRDDGGVAGVGLATVFHCTNFSGTSETLRFVTRDGNATLKSNVSQGMAHLQTMTAVTHNSAGLPVNVDLATGAVPAGTTAIAATSTNIVCTAMTFDASGSNPTGGVALRGIRFLPVPGSQE